MNDEVMIQLAKIAKTAELNLTTSTIIEERAKTHGDYHHVAATAQTLKLAMRAVSSGGWDRLTDEQKESLEQIATKVARILCGDPTFPGHYDDIGGYAELAKRS